MADIEINTSAAHQAIFRRVGRGTTRRGLSNSAAPNSRSATGSGRARAGAAQEGGGAMSTVITRERLSFWVGDKEYVEIEIPEALRDAVNTILDYTESYETPEQAALDAILEAAFDSGEVEPIVACRAR